MLVLTQFLIQSLQTVAVMEMVGPQHQAVAQVVQAVVVL
jgi:hypothetical protein